MKFNSSLKQLGAAVLIIFVSIGITFFLMQSNPPVEKEVTKELLSKVEISVLQPQKVVLPIKTQGLVEPRTKIRVLSEVNGRIVDVSPKWINGGFFRKGDVLLGVEDYNYKNQLAKARANLAQAKSNLMLEEGFSYVAKQDWEKRNPDTDNSAAKSLALREPQLDSIKAQYAAAEADVVSAENLLEKTKITAPFDGVLVNKVVDIGQYVSPGLGLAELYAIDVVEIKVPLTETQQAFLDLPGLNQTIKTPASITFNAQNRTEEQTGLLVRTEGVLDPTTKVLNGIVQVQDPYGLNKRVKSPLRLGTFVEITLQGKTLENIFVIPRRFLTADNKLWLLDADNKLMLKSVKVLPVRHDDVYVYEGLQPGDRLVSGAILNPLEGRVVEPVIAAQTEDKAGNKHE